MRKIKAWAVFAPHVGILWFTIQPNKKATMERFMVGALPRGGRSAKLTLRPGYSIRRITITVEEANEKD